MHMFKNRHVLKTDTKASIGEDETQETAQVFLILLSDHMH